MRGGKKKRGLKKTMAPYHGPWAPLINKAKGENCLVGLQAPQYKGGTSCNRILTSWGPW